MQPMHPMTNIRLRPTRESDLDFVLAAESAAENSQFVMVWSREQHREIFDNADWAHLLIETVADERPVGYIILQDVTSPYSSIQLRRIVVTDKGNGYGKEALRLVKELAFTKLGAHRLWLDVLVENPRARHVYETEGFTAEGILRDCMKSESGYHSLVVMSVLEHEYR